MRYFKILPIALLLKDNNVHPHGTIVSEEQLPRPVDELLAEGYIEEVEPPQSVKIEVVDAPVVDAPVVDAPVVDAPVVDAPVVELDPAAAIKANAKKATGK